LPFSIFQKLFKNPYIVFSVHFFPLLSRLTALMICYFALSKGRFKKYLIATKTAEKSSSA